MVHHVPENVILWLFASKLSRGTYIELEGPGLHTWTIESNSLEDICGDIHLKKILDDTSAYQNVRCHHMEKVSIHSKNSELY